MRKQNDPLPDDASSGTLPTVITVAELAQVMRLDKKTVYDQVATGRVPGVRRCGRSIRIHRESVLRWLAEGQDCK